MRLPTKAKTASGEVSTVDLRFLQPGVTTSAQLKKNLAVVDTGAGSPAFFWGRWETSNWGYGGFAGAPMVGGGVGGKRVWAEHNLIVTLDGKGVAQSWVIVSDKKLSAALDRLDSQDTVPLALPVRATVHLESSWYTNDSKPVTRIADLVLSADSLSYTNERWSRPNAARGSLRVGGKRAGRNNIRTLTYFPADELDPGYIQVHIQLKERAVLGTEKGATWKSKELNFSVDPPTLLALRRYVRETPAPK